MNLPTSERDLAAIAAALAGPDAPFTRAERALVRKAPAPSPKHLQQLRRAIARGDDPLGSAFCQLRSPELRREQGAVYTPRPIIDAMVKWAAGEDTPARIVDPGAGSGRFLFAAASAFPDAELVAVEIDPLAALMLRANAAALDMSDRLTLHLADYRTVDLPEIHGPTLFIGNPPYVRHHDIPADWKDWLAATASAYGFKASKLAGLHIHFFLKTRQLARPGDYGAFITSAEWLDVNYGDVLRKLLTNGLGGASLHVISPTAMPFADTATTGAITCFRVGRRGKGIHFRSVDTLADLDGLQHGQPITWSRLDNARRWSPLLRPTIRKPRGYIELGELCSVHRGQVTGCNAVWVAGAYTGPLPESVLTPAVTKARELFNAGPCLSTADELRRVIDLPVDLDELDEAAHRQVRRFLRWAKSMDADQSYVASNRRAWWAVKLRDPAPILCTYMARRPPAFVRNLCGARHLNIAHGIYPRESLPESVLDTLSAWLHDKVCVSSGRTYAGGLTKFEPKELERILIPPIEQLYERSEELDIGGTHRRHRNSKDTVSATTAG
jgi:predicted RNA methylase